MRFIYTTDLHGDLKKYEDVLRFAKENEVKLIHLGADILPKTPDILQAQKKFIKGFLQNFYTECWSKDIEIMTFFGNDDIYTRKKYFREFADLLDEKPQTFEGYEFKAYGYVPDLPFGLKQACKLEYRGWRLKDRLSYKKITGANEFNMFEIEDLEEYFKSRTTIQEDLKDIQVNKKTIMAIHTPPQSLSLDVCRDGRRVGSESVTKWIEEKQPRLVLCGHIHESYKKTGMWRGHIRNSLVIQPGQMPNKTTMVLLDIKEKDIKAHLIEI